VSARGRSSLERPSESIPITFGGSWRRRGLGCAGGAGAASGSAHGSTHGARVVEDDVVAAALGGAASARGGGVAGAAVVGGRTRAGFARSARAVGLSASKRGGSVGFVACSAEPEGLGGGAIASLLCA